MKIKFLNTAAILAFSVLSMSCNDKGDKADANEVEEVAVSEDAGAKYAVNAADSKIEWKGFKPTGTHNGTVSIETGTFMIEDDNIVSGNFLIDMTTIVSDDLQGDEKASLENHLKGTVEGKEGDFFNVKEFPNGAFEVTKSEKMDNGKMMVSGNLNLKGKKNNITIPVSMSKNGETVTLTSDKFTIDRTKWGVNYGSKSVFDNLGDKFINDDVELKIMLTANKAASY
ncbi:Polyisoprenoid-binding protein YceI [Flavobacteriaceae bacterium MAR_2010_188]|nr:Polyisoprenoid-binding protein YceI [Flavobacteriaceae bacterium MAR_2010_188]